MDSELMTCEQVADALGVSERTVRRWASDKVLPSVRIGRGFLRFRRDVIDATFRGQIKGGVDASADTENPFAMHLSPASFDMLPAEPEQGRECVIALWDLKKGRPHKALERICHWRRVERIPWLRPWKDTNENAPPE